MRLKEQYPCGYLSFKNLTNIITQQARIECSDACPYRSGGCRNVINSFHPMPPVLAQR